jgi:putative acetyltransferase
MIRQASASEADKIIQIWLESSRTTHDFIPFAYWADHAADMRSFYLPMATSYVCEQDGEITGFLSLVGTRVAALFIARAHQHRGYGKALIQYVQSHATSLSLFVYQKNSRAIRFYRNAGFQAAAERLDAGTGELEIEMLWSRT